MSEAATLYAVPEDLPIEGFRPGTSVLVAGPTMDAGGTSRSGWSNPRRRARPPWS